MNIQVSDKAVFLIDGSSFLYRAYYALKPLHTSGGVTVQAVYGFCRMIKKLIDQYQIERMVVVWDSKEQTDRQKFYPQYKKTRQAMPSDLFIQKEYIQKFCDLIGIAQLSLSGAEADDLMYSLAKKMEDSGYKIIIVSSDKDMRQIISDRIVLLDPFKDTLMDAALCKERYGFAVEKLPFYFALVGDSSDNIPGVKGIGEKGATALVQQFSTLKDLYDNLDKVSKERTKDLLRVNKENAFLSEQLFLLKVYDFEFNLDDSCFEIKNWALALPLFQELEFKSLIADIERKQGFLTQESLKKNEISLAEKYDFILVDTEQKLIDLVEKLKLASCFALDTETTGLDPMQARLVGISVCCEIGTSFYIPFGHQCEQQASLLGSSSFEQQQLSKEIVVKYLQPFFENVGVKKYLHNAKFDQLILLNAGIVLHGLLFDTMIAASLVLKDWEKKGLKELSRQLFNEEMIAYQDIVKKHKVQDFSYVPLQDATFYAAADAHQTFKLVDYFEQELRTKNLEKLFYQIEMPTSQILMEMQYEGIYCDANLLKLISEKVSKIIISIEREIHVLIGRDINLNSPKQVRELLFNELKLEPHGKSEKGDFYSTDAQVLNKLAKVHVVPGLILKYRELFKLKSTYIDALPGYINFKTDKIHTTWNQTLVATGRLSSSDPNLQNIPRGDQESMNDVRRAFLPESGWSFLAADYSQIELRILAHFSKEPYLVEAFLKNKDIHVQTAAQLFGVHEGLVTNEQRSVGKRINFSVLYGLTPYGLSRDMQISFKEAKNYIEKYFEQYPKVQMWMDTIVDFAKKNGFVQTEFGRRRYVPGIYEKNRTLFEVARRIAINSPIQGTAAEIMKLGMIAFSRALQKNNALGKILLQIHDEIVVMCPDSELEKIKNLLTSSLISVVDFEVPLFVSVKIGKNWQEVTK
ncbi:DNA polymerase I [Candidatus Dependentiae bacterium]|nr:DNA polymerase I [Candidatus Dependentiae bacterium]